MNPGLESLDIHARRTVIGRVGAGIRSTVATLTGRRKELVEQLAAARAANEEIESAIAMCDRCEAKIPNLLVGLAHRAVGVSGVDGRALLTGEYRERIGLLRLQKDLPEIRKYWLARRKALGFVPEVSAPAEKSTARSGKVVPLSTGAATPRDAA